MSWILQSEIAKIKQRVIRAAQHFAKYRGSTFQDGRTENEDRTFGKRKSEMADIGTEAEQRKQFITETEHRIAELPEKEWLSAKTMQEGTRLFGTLPFLLYIVLQVALFVFRILLLHSDRLSGQICSLSIVNHSSMI